ncbi:MAG: sulfatase-like hydrolase/transferase [Nakamurella sp.]
MTNVLLLCTDQQRFDALGAAGNPQIHTPHLDRLAAQGAMFKTCYAQSPVCGPSRASLMTGQYVHAHGLWANGVGLGADHPLVSRSLADAGYDCGLVGKFHIGGACIDGRVEPRLDDGFRVFEWAHDPYPGSTKNAYHQWLQQQWPERYRLALDPDSPLSFDTMPTESHYSHWIAGRTIDYLRNAGHDRPFFFVANFFDPHHDFGAPEEYTEMYDGAALDPPISRPAELADKPSVQTSASHESYAGHARGFTSYTPDEIQHIKARYYAMVSLVDDEVGRIVDELDDAGLGQDTLVIFTSDHGEMLGDHQLLLKGPMMYEGAVRVPLIMRWPATFEAGTVRSEPVELIDLTATILDVAGISAFPGLQGSSLVAMASDPSADAPRDWALCEYRNSGHPYPVPIHTTMLRNGTDKIVVWHGDPSSARGREGELYDLSVDPQELVNLWDQPAHRDRQRRLEALLIDVLVDTEDRSREREGYW